MKTMRLFSVELKRLLCGRLTWLVIFLTAASPAAGLFFYKPMDEGTMNSVYVGNPAMAGGLAGAVLFALFAIFEWDRVQRAQMDALTQAAVPPLALCLVRLFAMLCCALLALAAAMLAWLPYALHFVGVVFDGATYALAYLIFMGLALPLAILAAAAAYQFTRRADISVVLFAALAGLSLTVWADEWQLCWLNPCAWTLSDDFSNFRIFRSVAYMRMTWLLGLAGAWGLSYLCIRCYGYGALRSFAHNMRRLYRPALALVLLAGCVWSYAAQPFIDHSDPDLTKMTFYNLDVVEGVTCSQRYADICPDARTGKIRGRAAYQLQNTTGAQQVIPFTINPGYEVLSAQVNGKDVPFQVGSYEEQNMVLLEVTVPAQEDMELTLEYGGFLQEWNIMGSMQGDKEISSQYMCLENEAVAPTLQSVAYREEVLPATVDVTLPGNMTLVPFGVEQAQLLRENEDGTKTWRVEGTGRNMILYAGDYVREDIEAAGVTVSFYYARRHQPVMQAAGAAQAVRQVIEYCTQHYGPLSFAAAGSLKLIQSRAATGGYASIGASLANELDFTAHNLANTEKGTVPGEVMIHELVHQWWGLGNMFYSETGSELWSAEGLTVYTTYRIIKELYGEEYAREHYVQQWQKAVEDYYLNFYVRNPEYLTALPQEEQLNISNGLTQMRQYNEMPLKILKAEQLVGGEEAMDAILSKLFNRELDPMFPYLTYQEFLDACGLTEEELDLEQDFSV